MPWLIIAPVALVALGFYLYERRKKEVADAASVALQGASVQMAPGSAAMQAAAQAAAQAAVTAAPGGFVFSPGSLTSTVAKVSASTPANIAQALGLIAHVRSQTAPGSVADNLLAQAVSALGRGDTVGALAALGQAAPLYTNPVGNSNMVALQQAITAIATHPKKVINLHLHGGGDPLGTKISTLVQNILADLPDTFTDDPSTLNRQITVLTLQSLLANPTADALSHAIDTLNRNGSPEAQAVAAQLVAVQS